MDKIVVKKVEDIILNVFSNFQYSLYGRDSARYWEYKQGDSKRIAQKKKSPNIG